MKSGNQNLNCLCNIPSHNTGGNLAFDRFVNKTMFERKISILDPWFFKQFQSIHLLVGEIGSFAQYFFTPIPVSYTHLDDVVLAHEVVALRG